MTFATELQTYQGGNTYQNLVASHCIPVWRSGFCYITGGQSGWSTMTKVQIIGGTESDFSDLSLLNDAPNNVSVGTGFDWGIDWDGQLYCRTGLGMSRIDPSTWTRHDTWGALSYGIFPPPLPACVGNNNSLGGPIVPIRNGSGTMYWLGAGVSGSFGAFNDVFLQRANLFAGLVFQDHTPGKVLGTRGLDGGPGYMITSGSGSQAGQIHMVTCNDGPWVPGDWPTANSSIINTVIATVNPTDIDVAWTTIDISGCCMDFSDNNLLVLWTSFGAGSPTYLVKHNATTGAIIWKTSVNSDYAPGYHMQFSDVRGRFFFVVNGSIYGYDTSDGSLLIQQTTGLDWLLCSSRDQMFDDTTGVIIGNFNQQTVTAGSPTILNTSPALVTNSFAWMALYATNPITPPPPSNSIRRWGVFCRPEPIIQGI